MNEAITGKDWSKVDKIEKNDDSANSDYQVFFDRYHSLFGHEPSPYNMGLYQTIGKDENEEIVKATKYVGVLPLIGFQDVIDGKTSDKNGMIKISSRFGISPIHMIEKVLSGDDYYENPRMLKTKNYSPQEWEDLRHKEAEKAVLFGLLNGVGKVDLFETKEGNGKASKTDLGIVEAFGVFEIIDFVNKAKQLCKKNLKKQSDRVEQNLNCKVKGRILIQKQIKYNDSRGQKHKVYCAYNAMNEDIKENQIIKYALHLCMKNHGIGDSLAEDIRFCYNTLARVTLKKCSNSDFVGLKNNGAFRQYKDALESAKKIINRYSISYEKSYQKTTDKKDGEEKADVVSGKVLPYFIDMNLLFEYYCRAIFREAVNRINEEPAKKDYILELESSEIAKRCLFGNGDNGEKQLEEFFMSTYIPDIVINHVDKAGNKNVIAVFDAKYSDVENQKLEQRPRTHQILFYMKALGCNAGGLISPISPEKNDSGKYGEFVAGGIWQNGNKEKKEGELYYIPLGNAEANFDAYVKLTMGCLKNIHEEV